MTTPIILLLATASVLPADSAMWQLSAPAYENPAVKQWMLPRSHSSIGAGYLHERQNKATDVQNGTGEDYWNIGAETYLKYKSSTLWGDASYRNGHRRQVKWNETSDAELIYPYFTADSVGGDMNLERYRFAGGYADCNGPWGWGASISYEAGLYYRNVDPRPRNVTGLLDIAVGGARRLWSDYYAGVSVHYRKYKQTGDIDFKNELGVEKIYHLTGLGTHYNRFAGTGTETYYNGNRIGITANLYPSSGRGFTFTANLSRFTFNKVLTGLNKLPLTHVWHNAVTLQGGYLAPGKNHDWGVTVNFDAYRRHGEENVFGDASLNIYPVIASLDMYADNAWAPSLAALWQYHPGNGGLLLWVKGSARYNHRSEVYRTPRRRMLVNDVTATLAANVSVPFAWAWRFSAGADATLVSPTGCSLSLADANTQLPSGLITLQRDKYTYLSHRSLATVLRAGLQRQISSRIGLALDARWHHTAYTASANSNLFEAALSVIF